MKLLVSTFVILALLVMSACSKNEGGDNGGSPAAPPPQPLSQLPFNGAPYDNANHPDLRSKNFSRIVNKTYSIYNSDNFRPNRQEPGLCSYDPNVICVQEGNRTVPRPIRYYTIVTNPSQYLGCLSGYSTGGASFRIDIGGIRRASGLDTRRIYSSGDRKQSCLEQAYDHTSVMTQFHFDENGELSFRAQINQFEYRAIKIGYQYERRNKEGKLTNVLRIHRFVATGNDRSAPYLTVTSLVEVREPRDTNLELYVTTADGRKRDARSDLGRSDGFPGQTSLRFWDPILLRTSANNTLLNLNQQTPNQRSVNQPGGFQSGPFQQQQQQFAPGQQIPPGQVQFPIQGSTPYDPRFNPSVANPTKSLAVGGNILLMDIETLQSLETQNRIGPDFNNSDLFDY